VCDQHSTTRVRVHIPAHLSHTGEERWDWKGIDPCIVPLVLALRDADILTIASCCGHGHRPGSIALEDGRELIIAPDFDTARQIDALFPLTSYGEVRS
jgi:hypothetical protein